MWKSKFLTKKLIEWLRSHDDSDAPDENLDDPHDPQVRTYIYGNAIELGEWK